MMAIRGLFALVGFAALWTAPAAAQQRVCDLMPDPPAREATRLAAPDGERIYIRGPARFECSGGVTVLADSAVSYSGRGELHLVGNVFYGDSIKTLTADWVNYLGRDGRLFARGNVILTDRESASVIRGRELEYHAADERRPETRTIVRGSPSAVLYTSDGARGGSGRRGASPRDSSEPFHVTSDRMEILGERFFHADGNAALRRGDTRAWARDATFDQNLDLLVLTGDARVLDEEFELTGRVIRAFLEGDALREVDADRDAVLLAEDLRVDAAKLRMFFEEGELHRMVARAEAPAVAASAADGGQPAAQPAPPATGSSSRALVTATDFRLEADSIDAYMPAQTLERVIAVGSALGERLEDNPDAAVPSILARDWLRGDTITGYFALPSDSAVADPIEIAGPTSEHAAPEAIEDGTDAGEAPAEPGDDRSRVVLERLVASAAEGGQARALYLMREEGEADRPAANYLVAARITLWMEDGEVTEMEADGPIRGIYVDPVKATGTEEPQAATSGRRNRGR